MEQNNSPARARLCRFFDTGTFVEIGAYVQRRDSDAERAGVICGYGSLDGRLVFAFAEDAGAMHGAVDARHADKIEDLYKKARRAGAPVVGMFDSAGAVVFDGAAALGGYGKLLAMAADASGRIPQVALVSGTCAGTMAAVARLFDFVVVNKESGKLYLTSPAHGTGVTGAAEEVFGAGIADALAMDEAGAFAAARQILSYLPDSAADGAPADLCTDDVNRALSLGDTASAREALGVCADAGSFFEVYGGAGAEVQAGLALLGGCSTAVLAIDGELTLAGARKLEKLLRVAGAFALPVVSFVNCSGLAAGEPEAEMIHALSALALAWKRTGNAKIVAVTGAAIGAGFLFGGARTLGAELVFALPGAEISALSAKTAVAFLWNDRITGATTRADLETKWRTEEATAVSAAATGEVDDVVAPAELRARILAALYMLAGDRGV